MSDQTRELLDRIEALEKSNRRMKIAGGSVLATGLLGLVMSASGSLPCKSLWAERFILADNGGKNRMVLDAYAVAEPTATLFDKEGKQLEKMPIAHLFRQAKTHEAAAEKSDGDRKDGRID